MPAPAGLGLRDGCLFVPSGSDTDIVYLFDSYPLEIGTVNSHQFVNPYALYRNTIKLHGQGGKPEVIVKNETVFTDTLINGSLKAVRHANGRDWWLIEHEMLSNRYYKFLLKGDSVIGSFTQNIGSVVSDNDYGSGNACFSIDGSKYALICKNNDIDLFDFNRCTGELTYNKHDTIHTNFSAQNFPASCAFSPNGRYFYLNTLYKLYQYDLEATDFATSRTLIDTCDHWSYFGFEGGFSYMTLAPNGKIYCSTWNGVPAIHVINSPNLPGVSCQFFQHDTFPTFNSTLPNVINYDLGALPLYLANAGLDRIIAYGETTTLGNVAQTGLLYQWTPATGLDNSNVAQPLAMPNETTTYYLTITDASGLSGCNERMDTVVVTVKKIPFIPTFITIDNPEWEIQNLATGSTVLLYDVLGRLVYGVTYDGTVFSFSNYAAATYFYRIILPTGEVEQGKVVYMR